MEGLIWVRRASVRCEGPEIGVEDFGCVCGRPEIDVKGFRWVWRAWDVSEWDRMGVKGLRWVRRVCDGFKGL